MKHTIKRLMAFGAGGLAALSARAVAFGQETGEAPPAAGGGVAGYGLWDWIQIGFRLALVLAVIWGAFIVLRWYMRRVNGDAGTPGMRQLQIVETRSLGPNRALHLVRVGGRAVLIGVTQERINQLMVIDDPEEVERLAELPPTSETRSFRSLMGSLQGSLPGTTRAGERAQHGLGGGRGRANGQSDTPDAPRKRPAGTGRLGKFVGVIGGVLRSFAGLPAAGTPRARRGARAATHESPPAATQESRRAASRTEPAARVPQPMVGGLFDSTPASAVGLRARNGYGQAAPAPQPAAARRPAAGRQAAPRAQAQQAQSNRGSRAALDAAADAAARAPGRQVNRELQMDELRRAIASARNEVGADADAGRAAR